MFSQTGLLNLLWFQMRNSNQTRQPASPITGLTMVTVVAANPKTGQM